MKTEQLRCFIAIAELGSYHKAAQALHKSQPTITKAIQNLEQYLGIDLFAKDSYRATLTDNGKLFYKKAKPLLNQLLELKDIATTLKLGQETKINLAVDCLYPEKNLTELCQTFEKNYPRTELHIFTENLGGAIERLLDNDVDLAITENLGSHHTLEAKKLLKINLIAAATPTYFEQHREQFNDVTRLYENRQIILRDSSRLLEKYNFGVVEGAHNWSVTELHKKKQFICDGLGWGRLPEHLLETEVKNKKLVTLDFPHTQTKTATLSLLRRNDIEHGEIASSLWSDIEV